MTTRNPSNGHDCAAHRPMLLKLALLQLRNRDEAEDVVQETLAAAIQASASFAGRSSLRTWLVGILKHKIIDQIRRSRARLERPLELPNEETSLAEFDGLFSADGHYADMPAEWGNPEAALAQSRFHDALQRCLDGLPQNTARAFVMREVMGMETAEICKELGVSATNCWVLLYRARMSLRVCLQQGWFSGDDRSNIPGSLNVQNDARENIPTRSSKSGSLT